jgi:anti-sigma regulatory factor (Ser/Thr protein kinase)
MEVSGGVSVDTDLLEIKDQSQISMARRQISLLAHSLGFDPTQRGRIEIIASELATNVWLHGRGGNLLVRSEGLGGGIEIIAIDRGPGMANVDECLRDGFSTAGTSGNGLGAIRRLADVFDIYSRPGYGTLVLAQCLRQSSERKRFVVGALCIAVAGETVCGDAWSVLQGPHGARICVVDGLGHGPDAAQASHQAIRAIGPCAGQPLTLTIEIAHRAIAGSRGAAVAMGDIDINSRQMRYLGVGNIAGVIIQGADQRSMVSHNGIVGHQQRKVQEFLYPWNASALLVMHSDGLQTRWNLEAIPGLVSRHPSLIAAGLYRDFARGRDDVTVVVMREVL